jgi:hypothetical protein
MHMSTDNDRPQKTRTVFPENRGASVDNSWTKSTLCHKCGITGHIRPSCEWQRKDKHLERLLPSRKKGVLPKKKQLTIAEPPAESPGLAPPVESPAPAPTNPAPATAVPAPPVLTRKVLIRPKPTPCKMPAEMDLADFRAAMEQHYCLMLPGSD